MSNKEKIVAVVDDDPEMRAAMVKSCRRSAIARRPSICRMILVCARTSNANCLVVDIQLGDISGIEFAHQLTADGIRVPVIFMTGLDDELVRSQAAAAGGIAFLRKPFSAQILNDAVRTAIG